jgi:Bacterial regulatory proteins, luxR family
MHGAAALARWGCSARPGSARAPFSAPPRRRAGRRCLSEKTIEHNLSRVYAKLGVRSRVELAGRMGR